MFLLLLSVVLFSFSTSIDLCDLINKDYCFYFGESSCYLKICECEQERCTQEDDSCSYSYWCDINGDYVVNETDILVIDMNCPSLKENCLDKQYFNGYCYLYQSHNCDHNDDIEKKSQSRNLSESCQKWGQTCAKKWTRHFACRQFRKLCHDYTLPPRVGNITEELDDIRTYQAQEHGAHWERNMRSRCRRWQSQCTKRNNRKACAKVARRCDDFLSNDTVIRREDSSSLEDGEDAIRVILNSIDSKGNQTESTTSRTTEALNYKKNMKARCRSWRSYCQKHPANSQCDTYFRRCEEFSPTFKEDLSTLPHNMTLA